MKKLFFKRVIVGIAIFAIVMLAGCASTGSERVEVVGAYDFLPLFVRSAVTDAPKYDMLVGVSTGQNKTEARVNAAADLAMQTESGYFGSIYHVAGGKSSRSQARMETSGIRQWASGVDPRVDHWVVVSSQKDASAIGFAIGQNRQQMDRTTPLNSKTMAKEPSWVYNSIEMDNANLAYFTGEGQDKDAALADAREQIGWWKKSIVTSFIETTEGIQKETGGLKIEFSSSHSVVGFIVSIDASEIKEVENWISPNGTYFMLVAFPKDNIKEAERESRAKISEAELDKLFDEAYKQSH